MDLGALRPAGSGGDQGVIKDGTTQSFAKDVLEASRTALVLVDFWAAWCGPCKQLTPVLEKVVKSYGGRVHLVKINTDEHPGIAGQLRVQSLPTVYAFRDGRPLDGFMGVQPESAIRALIDRLVGPDEGDELQNIVEAAEAALEEGDLQSAAEAFATVLQEDQHNVAAIAGLAKCYLKSGDTERAEQTLALVPPDKAGSAAIQSVKATIELAKAASKAGDHAEFETASPPIPLTMKPVSNSRLRLPHAASSRKPSITFSNSSAAIATGTIRPAASNSSSSSMRGAPRNR